jgi:PAS domain S-box-containing protein
MLLMCAVSEWSFAYALEYASPELHMKLFWVRVEYIGNVWIGPLFLLFVYRLVGKEGRFSSKAIAALLIIPAMTFLGALTNDAHGLVWKNAWLDTSEFASLVVYERGGLFWLYILFAYTLLFFSTALLLRAFSASKGIYRKQTGVILLGLLVPWIANAYYLSGLSPFNKVDLTPFAFMISGLACAYGISRYRILDLSPAAGEAVMEGISDCVLVLDMKNRLVNLNKAAAALIGVKRDDLLGMKAEDILPELFPIISLYQNDGGTQTELLFGSEKEEREYEIRVSSLFHNRGRQIGWLVIVRDITDRRQEEAKLWFTQFAIDNLSEAAFWVNPEGRFIYVNESACNLLGYRREELLGLRPQDITTGFDETKRRQVWAAMKSHGSNVFESCLRSRSGEIIDVEISANILEFNGQLYSCAFVRDITYRKKAEEFQKQLESRLRQAQKMEAIGALAGGVAHDLNNILSGILTYPDLLLHQLPEDSSLRQPLTTIKATGQKAAAIVQDLLTLARRGVLTDEPVSINEVIMSYLKSPEHARLTSNHPNVTIKIEPGKDLMTINGSHIHLHKTLMNLVMNAAEAMLDGGRINIKTENIHIDGNVKGLRQIEDGYYVLLTVSDTGVGISPEERERIFEPFYTKKAMDRSGTGLGMAVVWNAVRDHNGYIDLICPPEGGAHFRLYFPASRNQPKSPALKVSLEIPLGRGERILIVDDIEEQRAIGASILTRLKYSVAALTSGEEAVDYLKNHQVDLIVLDMIMEPGIDGLETYDQIRRICPGQKAVIVSGFSESDRVRKAQELGAGPYLKKPYTLEELARTVRAELDRVIPGHP